MKRIFSVLLTTLLFGFQLLIAQPSEVTNASLEFDDRQFESAYKSLQKALANQDLLKEKQLVKAWLLWGKTNMELYQLVLLNKGNDALKAKYPNMLEDGFEGFDKAKQLAGDDIKSVEDQMKQYVPVLGTGLMTKSIEVMNDGNNDKALALADKAEKIFKQAKMEIHSISIIKGHLKLQKKTNADTLSALVDLEKSLVVHKKTIAKLPKETPADQRKMIENDPSVADVYATLISIYARTKNDIEKAQAMADSGIKRFPDVQKIKDAEMDIYMFGNNVDKAISKYNAELQQNPGNIRVMLQLASIMEKKSEADEKAGKPDADVRASLDRAVELYKKVLEKEPENNYANYNLGAMYVNKAVLTRKKMNDEKDDKKYDLLKAKIGRAHV